jgi:hypothetical protein
VCDGEDDSDFIRSFSETSGLSVSLRTTRSFSETSGSGSLEKLADGALRYFSIYI